MSSGPELANSALRVSVRQRIEHGRLPFVRSRQIVAGYGSGRLCAACDEPITHTQAEYEVEDSRNGRRLRFHASCHALWQSECAGA
jgi:hypothetical protein